MATATGQPNAPSPTPASTTSSRPIVLSAREGPSLAWELIELPNLDVPAFLDAVEFRGSIVAIAGTDGRHAALTSPDGRSWETTYPEAFAAGDVLRIAASDREILAIGGKWFPDESHVNYVWSSRDGKTWTRVNTTGLEPSVGILVGVASTPQGWVGVTQTFTPDSVATNVLVSRDGRSWRLLPRMPWRGRPLRVVSGPHGTFFLLGNDGGRPRRMGIWGSRDLQRWTHHQIRRAQPALFALADGPRAVVATGIECWRSSDGVTWKPAERIDGARFFLREQIVALADGFFAVGHTTEDAPPGHGAWTSSDGRRWIRLKGWARVVKEDAVRAIRFRDGVFAWVGRHRPDWTSYPVVVIGTRPG